MIIWIESKTGESITVNFNPSVELGEFSFIRLKQCTLYNSWFNINATNNVLKFKTANGKVNTKTIKPGNYNIETLNEEINLPNNITFHKSKPTGRTLLKLSKDWEILFGIRKNLV